jgi:hypothetical protein
MQAILTISKTATDHYSVVNFVKSIPLETSIFQQDRQVMDATYEGLILHTEAALLSSRVKILCCMVDCCVF